MTERSNKKKYPLCAAALVLAVLLAIVILSKLEKKEQEA